MTTMPYIAVSADEALKPWLDGPIVARHTNRFDETSVVTENGDGFSLIRVFPISLDGDYKVSCDLQGKPIADVLAKLLSRL